MVQKIEFTPGKTILCLTTISFDIFFLESLLPLTMGMKIVVASETEQTDLEKLFELIEKNGIEMLQGTPSRMQMLLENSKDTVCLSSLKDIIIGGEAIPKIIAVKLKERTKSRIYNRYGPTETAVWSTVKDLTKDESINIGKPIANTYIYIIGTSNHLQPVGVPGELCIAGDGLARGYWNQSELTAEKFIPNPFASLEFKVNSLELNDNNNDSQLSTLNSQLYKTGDLARWLPDGNIEFLGRIDHQVKVRGYRIELGEIESRLLKHESIKEAVVIAKDDQHGSKYLAAYIVGEKEFTVVELREYLSKEMPDFMIPSCFVQLEKMPLNRNGKIDRKALPEPDGKLNTGMKYEAPTNESEHKLVEIWREVLGIENIGINDHFFELGGHSLKATTLVSKIHQRFQVELPLREVFQNPTIKELAQRIKATESSGYSSIQPTAEAEYYPVSSAQKRLYLLNMIEGESASYNMPGAVIIEGKLDPEKIKSVFMTLVERHEAFRTSFFMMDGEPVQKIHLEVEFEITYIKSEAEKVDEVLEKFVRTFDLSKAPLLRVGLVELSPDKYLLIYDMHHIITDGISINILINEFASLYNGRELPVLRIQYKDFAIWHNQLLNSSAIKRQEEYWLNLFQGEIPVLDLPADYSRLEVKGHEGNSIDLEINETITQKLNEFSAKNRATLYITMLAAYNILLARATGQEDIIVGTPTAGRQHPDLENIVGMFVNTTVLRNYPKFDQTFLEFFKEMKESTFEALENQDYQFEMLLEKLNLNRDLSRNPLFDTIFNFHNFYDRSEDFEMLFGDLKISPYPVENKTTKFDLTVYLQEIEGKVKIRFKYRTGLFKKSTIQYLLSEYERLLEEVSQNQDKQLKDYPVFQKKNPRIEGNQVCCNFPFVKFKKEDINQSIVKRFEEIAMRYRDKIAVKTGKSELTYAALNNYSNRVAHNIIHQSEVVNQTIALLLEHNVCRIIGMLGALKSGKIYVPLDPAYPEERLSYMLEDSEARLIVTNSGNMCLAQKLVNQKNSNLKIINIDSFETSVPAQNPDIEIKPEQPAYILYTSGSTGRPKGVVQNHRNVLHFIQCYTNNLRISDMDRLTLFSSYSFDAAVMDIYGALLNGARLYPYHLKTEGSMERLSEWIDQEKISIYHSTPTVYRYFMDTLNEEKLLSVRLVVMGGEAVYKKDVDAFKKHFTDTCLFINGLGPTESTVTLQYFINQKSEITNNSVPVGYPVEDTEVYLLNVRGEEASVFETGEIVYKSDYLALGYWGQPEKTEEVFIKDPLTGLGRVYRSGDMGRLLPDGSIEFTGRNDFQVKIRGHRIELADIEAVLDQIEGIAENVVTSFCDEKGERYLAAYYVAGKDFDLDPGMLRNVIQMKLPDYMTPSYFVKMDQLPLTPSGKIDRKALPVPENMIRNEGEDQAPTNDLERKLVEIWREILSAEKIGINDNFFNLGGQSLKATTLMSKIHKEFSVELPLREIFQSPTIKELAKSIKEAETSNFFAIQPTAEAEYYPVSAAQKRMYVLNMLEGESASYNMSRAVMIEGILDREKLEGVFRSLLERHDTLRTSFEMIEGEPLQKVHQKVEFRVNYLETNVEKLKDIAKEFIKPFDLSQAPLLRVTLVKIAAEKHVLFYDMHHIISDGASLGILVKEFKELYNGEDLPALRIQYKDFSVWQYEFLNTDRIKKQEEYWLKIFKEEIPVLNMPLDFKRAPFQTFNGNRIGFPISSEVKKRLDTIAKKYHTTLNILFFSIYGVLLNKYSGQNDIIIGSLVAGRRHADLAEVVGMFANFIPIRLIININDRFGGLLRHINQIMLEAYEHQDYPFDQIISKLSAKIDHSRNPLFDTMLIFHNEVDFFTITETKDLRYSEYEIERDTSKLDFKLDIIPYPDERLGCSLEYNSDLFKEETMKNLVNHFNELTNLIANNSDVELSEINLFTDDERLAIEENRKRHLQKAPLQVAISATFTAEPIENYIKLWCGQFELDTEVKFAAYNQVFQELIDPSGLISNNTGINLLLVRFEDWIRDDRSNQEKKLKKLEQNFSDLLELLKSKKKSVPYFVGVFPVSTHLALDEVIVKSLEKMNAIWKVRLETIDNVYVIDFTVLPELYAIDETFDAIKDKAGHLPFTDEFYAAMGTMIARNIRAWNRQIFKVIVLDCDNSLWEGVCGEEGAHGITVAGPYLELQRFMLRKYKEGMLLVLCSKNNEADVWEVFEKNEQMLLKKEYFAGWRINWRPKSENIKDLARELNLGSDSFIYLDDSAVECAEVMTNCPEVLTLRLPEDSSQIPVYLNHVWAFDRMKITGEDQKRAGMYQSEKRRREEQNRALSMDDFLQGLELKMDLRLMNREELARVAQLTQRTNQFNLSIIRRTEEEIEALSNRPGTECRVIEVCDRFGEYGIVGAVITQEDQVKISLDTFLLSCRALGRGIEDAILDELGKYCRAEKHPSPGGGFLSDRQKQAYVGVFRKTGWQRMETTAKYLKFKLDVAEIPAQKGYVDCDSGDAPNKNQLKKETKDEEFVLDHIAIATSDIEQAREFYRTAGFQCGEIIYDPLQRSNLAICSKEGYDSLELVGPVDSESPSFNLTKDKRSIPYHLCYRVGDFERFLTDLERGGLEYQIISEAQPAKLFDGRAVMFLLIKGVGLIELLKKIDDEEYRNTKNNIIRIVVPEVKKPVKFYSYLGYTQEGVKHDILEKKLTVTLKKPGAGNVELIVPLDESVKEYQFLSNNGPQPYQVCYQCDNLSVLKELLEDKKYEYSDITGKTDYGTLNDVEEIIQINDRNYHLFYQKAVKTEQRKAPAWEVNLVNEEKLLHHKYLYPLINHTAQKLLKLPIYEQLKEKLVRTDYVAPSSVIEQKLTKIWREVLGVEKIGINDNFFNLGGHSLKATTLISKIHKEFSVELPLREIFQSPTIKELAKRVGGAEKSIYSAIQPVTEQEYYQVSSAQKRLYVLSMLESASTSYNMPAAVTIEGILDRGKFAEVFRSLSERHETLRASFELIDGEPVQKVHPKVEFQVNYLESDAEKVKDIAQEFIKPFDLSKAPLMRVTLVKISAEKYVLLYDMHHIISDGTSIQVLVREFAALYNGETLPELKDPL